MRTSILRCGLAASLGALLAACAVFSPKLPPPPMVEGLRPASAGTGFFVARDRILTNYHVVKECKALTAGNNIDDWEVGAELIAGDERFDLAVLAAASSGIMPARFRTRLEGDALRGWAIVGYPDNARAAYVAEMDRVSLDPADIFSTKRAMVLHGEVRRGNSGSPVLDEGGGVVGVVFGRIDSEALYRDRGVRLDNIGVAIPGRTVLEFLRRNNIAVRSASGRGTRDESALLDEARRYVRQVICWR